MIRTALVLVALLGATAASAKECRTPVDAPPGVRVPPAPGCAPRSDRLKQAPSGSARMGRDSGFIDLGNGSQLRVSGRVRLEASGRR